MRVHAGADSVGIRGRAPRGVRRARGGRAAGHHPRRWPPVTRAAAASCRADAEAAEAMAGARTGPTPSLAGERGGEALAGFDLGNSPAEFTAERVGGRTVVLTTTNGTAAMLNRGPARRRARRAHQCHRGRALGARAGSRRDRPVRGRQRGILAGGHGVRGPAGGPPGRCLPGRRCSPRAPRPLWDWSALMEPGSLASRRTRAGAASSSAWAAPPTSPGACGRREPDGAGIRGGRLRAPGARPRPRRSARSRAREPPDRADPVPHRAGAAIMVFLISSSRVSVLIAAVIFVTA